MKSLKLAGALAAMAMIATPIAANANFSRAAAPVAGESEMGANASGTAAAIFGLVAFGVFLVASGGDDEGDPISA
ncbi:hypothetical protein [Qipengyuania atrilutea]|uniref:Ferrochelatase n=1 Tax=Qipengyuania atrilutea TaxID=2744473 RepID=A0A850GXN4_9SPHN|nr:hypothetical protein [Actirhodobacter atriluteus]NVD44331.1 hypothetical protein [Actirhodobacter atriluteus]